MSEECKSAEGDYVMMGKPGAAPGRGAAGLPHGIDDPNLPQEEKDHRLAIALQQQENAAALEEHKKKHEATKKADMHRTARSGTFSRLANVRDKDHGMLSVPADYTTDNAYVNAANEPKMSTYAPPPKNAKPEEIQDYKLAAELQRFEQVGAGTVREMEKIAQEEEEAAKAQAHRTGLSTYKK
ncbi:expressed unknown protein [Seminavis robusta]|uniref:Uncharacterized protein n=1 Tax=Seminavis robusta TaxID=568900 RepID=A0A9N8DGH6_9STRA|nr:expressed unknown protein [Seminavis robusta]|eukprot:Sro56_g032910.1 n/a (183) ;mRNA; f:104833-105381